MSLLYSHAGNPHLSLAELAEVPTPAGKGRFHRPYPFHTYVEDVESALDRVGFEVLERDLEVTKDQNRFFGALAIAPRGGEPVEGGIQLLVVTIHDAPPVVIPRRVSARFRRAVGGGRGAE